MHDAVPNGIGLVLTLVGGVLTVFSRFNTLVRSQKRVQEAWAGIDVQLRQRASLIPNLVEAIRGYAEHEREVFEQVTRARGALQQAGTAGQAGAANNLLTQALGHVFAVAEPIPSCAPPRTSSRLCAPLGSTGRVEER